VAHKPVLLNESIDGLAVRPGGRYIDCTLGGGGHSLAILEGSQPGGELLGIDADPSALKNAATTLLKYSDAVHFVHGNFVNIDEIASRLNFVPVDGIIFDLGLSSSQLDNDPRGFSFQKDAPLDMRFSPSQHETAEDIVNTASEKELVSLLREYGEEPFAGRIARRIVAERPVTSTLQLARLVESAVGGRKGRIHPATRAFQALRIAVNSELENLETALNKAVTLLVPSGRLVVISYHSLEDRIVKQFMQRESRDCICPPEALICRCGHVASLRLINRKVIVPGSDEVKENPRSRSAKLRIAEKTDFQRKASVPITARYSELTRVMSLCFN